MSAVERDLAGFVRRFGWPERVARTAPLAIAHRGASDHAPENTLRSFAVAHELGAEMWEIDVRLSADGVAVVIHDADLFRLTGRNGQVAETPAAELATVRMADETRLPSLDEVIELARRTGTGLYIELKDAGAGPVVLERLKAHDFRFAAIGSFVPDWIAGLRRGGCPWPLAVLVPRGADPVAHADPARPDIVHLCWEDEGQRSDRLITPDVVARIRAMGAEIVAWHEERAEVVAELLKLPLLGICSNRPGMLKPWTRPAPAIVCHRGANAFAPENTLEAARICFEQGFDYVEADLRQTSDGALMVMHDADVARTTNGQGLVRDMTEREARGLDAGSWFGERHRNARVPLFAEMLAMARAYGGGIYAEIKQADPLRVLHAVDAHDMLARCFFWSADPAILDTIRAAAPAARIMAPRWMFGSVAEAAARHGAEIIEFDDTRDDLAEIAECRRLGLKSMIYSRARDPGLLASYAAMRPDLVNLDRPDLFRLVVDHAANPRVAMAGERS